jgi:hypothetical protein
MPIIVNVFEIIELNPLFFYGILGIIGLWSVTLLKDENNEHKF